MKESEIIRQFNINANEHQTLMDKLEDFGNTLKNVEISIAGLPEKILEKTDNRYASKSLEEDVKSLKDKNEQRNYDWLKYFITTGVLVLLTFLGLK